MLLVIGYFRGDLAQAERLAEWMRELGGLEGHQLLVARDKGTEARPFADVGFDSVDEIEIRDAPPREWPFPANNVFQHCVRHIYNQMGAQPFFWIEPDVVPFPMPDGPGWLATMCSEYAEALAAGKSFLGDFVSVHTPEMDVPDHMSGIGFYPGNLLELDFNGDLMLCDSIAWDVSGAHIILPRMARSELLHHAWKHAPFDDPEAVQREIYGFKPKCVLFHADKSGTLIEILRKGREEAKPSSEVAPPVHVASEPSPVSLSSGDFAGSTPAPCAYLDPAFGKDVTVVMRTDQEQFTAFQAGMELSPVCDILIKSYPQDYPLLEYCLKSLRKFASGFRQIIVIYPEGEPPNLWPTDDPGFLGVEVKENGDGYSWQMALKANAHEFSDAKYICHFDSDTFITRPITPATFFQNGKSFWLYTPYAKIDVPWQASTQKFMQGPVANEYMRRHPTFAPRSLHVAAAAFCLMTHGVTLKDYIMAQPLRDVSEFNLLGALAYLHHNDDFTWIEV